MTALSKIIKTIPVLWALVAQAAINPNSAIGLLVIRSGSPVHLTSPVVGLDGKLSVGSGSGDYFTGFLLPDGRIRTGGTDSWLTVGSDSSLSVGLPPTNFEVDASDHLVFNGSSGFIAALEDAGYYSLYSSAASLPGKTTYAVILRVIENSAASSLAVSPTSVSLDSGASQATSSGLISSLTTGALISTIPGTFPSVVTEIVSTTTTVADVSTSRPVVTITPTVVESITPIPQVNGARSYRHGFCNLADAALAAFGGAGLALLL